MVYRVYAEKKAPFAVEAGGVYDEITTLLGITALKGVRVLHRYDVEGMPEDGFERCVGTVFSEPPLDVVWRDLEGALAGGAADAPGQAGPDVQAAPAGKPSQTVFAVEYLPGQFDQRADSAAECIQLAGEERPTVRSATVYVLQGELAAEDVAAIKKYLINPVEAREAALEEKTSLALDTPAPEKVPVLEGFLQLDEAGLAAFITQYGLAMDEADLAFFQDYFKTEGRQPTLTELRMVDTYWSDHCRHTTFGTVLEHVAIEDAKTLRSYNEYLALREQLYQNRPDKKQTLMDIATIGAKAIKAKGGLQNLDESEEINACSVKIKAKVKPFASEAAGQAKAENSGANAEKEEDWLLLFKNETHNHPTEIEPFGGAATCIGGAIRDPLSGRGYVFGAMRVTGAGDPRVPVEDTLPGKLPQRKLCRTAAAGYASYGNQIGLATGQVTEIYHPGYIAKRMEIGAVLGAAPMENVRREVPAPGDVVILLGGRTGRDGCGGATGSSKAHTGDSLETCGAEVQKGNAPVERKLQRLFRSPAATRLIKRCNDFGAGGVCVAIGELADGLRINLDKVPKKYDGLTGTELAISESQERMAVVVEAKDADAFIALAGQENLEATLVAEVTESPRLVMEWQGEAICDIARAFLNSNGAEKFAGASVPAMEAPAVAAPAGATLGEKLAAMAADLNRCSQKGLSEMFDSTIGAASVRMPFGGRFQLTPTQAMVMKLPVEGETATCAGMAYGFDPYISEQNPYTGAYLAVVESVAKLAAAGFALRDMTLTFQEYFERLKTDPARWGKPFAALLGALQAQLDLGAAAIGGKDSMSGSFEDLDVPPTLVSFAVAAGEAAAVPAGEFQVPGSRVVVLRPVMQEDGLTPTAAGFKMVLGQLYKLISGGQALSVYAVGSGGVAEALFKMGLGNRLGIRLGAGVKVDDLFAPGYGSFVVEMADDAEIGEYLGETSGKYVFAADAADGGESVDMAQLQEVWEGALEGVFPYRAPSPEGAAPKVSYDAKGATEGECACGCGHGHSHDHAHGEGCGHEHAHDRDHAPAAQAGPKIGIARPKALIPVFPGTNCEYDTARAVRRAGGDADVFVVRNLTPAGVAESAAELARRIGEAQMLVIPGGFSGGDEPEGSAKLIAAFFRGAQVADAVTKLLEQRDGLALGICNGFQALVKLGLLPHGRITPQTEDSLTLTFNAIGRHQSMLVRTRVASNLSPWLAKEALGSMHTIAISNGEGRFVADKNTLKTLLKQGQIASQYVDAAGEPTLDVRYNPSGSVWAIEGITSPDGRVFGKMGHSERSGEDLYRNVPGNKYQRLFEGGVEYFAL